MFYRNMLIHYVSHPWLVMSLTPCGSAPYLENYEVELKEIVWEQDAEGKILEDSGHASASHSLH
ncbi:unnamed protein product, partial [Urochloa humidicola]